MQIKPEKKEKSEENQTLLSERSQTNVISDIGQNSNFVELNQTKGKY
jgi:hypothetical protein